MEKFKIAFPPPTLSPQGSKPSTVCDTLTFAEWVIRSRDRGPSISTDPSDGCGGYSSGNIYSIDCADLNEEPWTTALPGGRLTGGPMARHISLCIDTPLLINATAIGIKDNRPSSTVNELFFLTPIDIARIKLHHSV